MVMPFFKKIQKKLGLGPPCGNPRVLMYHMVCPRLPYKYYHDGHKVKNYLRVTPSDFERQLQWLLQENFSFYKMERVLDESLPEKSIFLTFDDGYADNYNYAYKLLKKYSLPATIYLIVNRLSNNWAMDKATGDVLQELNDQVMLANDQIEEMIASDLIEFGAHTLDHVALHQISEEEAWHQIQKSRMLIAERYNIPCNSFAYPFGFFDEKCKRMVKKAGFTNACTTEDGTNSSRQDAAFKLRRIMVSGNDSMRKFKLKILKAEMYDI